MRVQVRKALMAAGAILTTISGVSLARRSAHGGKTPITGKRS